MNVVFTRHKSTSYFTNFDIYAIHRVQETDGSYFESYTALSWKRDNRRFSAIRVSENRAETLPDKEHEAGAITTAEDEIERPGDLEHLYTDVLYTVANTVGAPAPGGQVRLDSIF